MEKLKITEYYLTQGNDLNPMKILKDQHI